MIPVRIDALIHAFGNVLVQALVDVTCVTGTSPERENKINHLSYCTSRESKRVSCSTIGRDQICP